MKKRRTIFLFLLSFLLIGLWPLRCLLLIDYREQTLLGALPFSLGERFTVEWVHSVELTPWRETYTLGESGGLLLVETAFRSFGAGVPATFEQSFEIEQGWIVAKGLHAPRDDVIYLISRSDYTLTVGMRTWQITQLIAQDRSLQFSIGWRPWWYPVIHCLPREDVKANGRSDPLVYRTAEQRK
ncbi:DUF1850 domain-containing protein [Brevibacillus humidisoli]|uniref:DUF1850 domain-containing protein n=1 Tax=Brevibacillus humidisoli TaxID=2895522 RepID=UPI001E296D14|nr:DUF1850 domain-containing protein [Brevibacillus humidisoli]UFJ39978.1 DUF1850 domain-containing protein [Brevibacillus humidisoli]